jgi:flavin-dependent dehydrogenase
VPDATDMLDVIVVGGGPAGCAAALAARRAGRTVRVLRRHKDTASTGCAGWIGPAALALCGELGVDAATCGQPFDGVHIGSWDLKQTAQVHGDDLHGRIVSDGELGQRLLEAVTAAGADVHVGPTVTGLDLGEDDATLHRGDTDPVRGRAVLIADGAHSATAPLAQLHGTRIEAPPPRGAVAPVTCAKGTNSLHVLVSANAALRVATLALGDGRGRAALVTHDRETPPIEQLHSVFAAAIDQGLMKGVAGEVVEVPSQAGVALEFESHVGKRCILVGQAGGFAAALSGEGLYPSMQSAVLAAETVERALAAEVFQDELATFSATWRSRLADYLRLPNTDLGLLLPMVFKNEQIAARVARALPLGQPF